jgi:sensor c-di-GMP phosphodiesterase-like protein
VLARRRDIDGTTVLPSRFIDIVEQKGRTEEFTRLVADRAYEELSACLPSATRLQVAFNIFACDLDSAKLLAIYSRFLDGDRRFEPAIELVESQDIDFEAAERAIDELDWAGIKSYIDDFGIGYSSIERVATLAVHGVKLDRSFAMSPPDSIMGQMLVQVLEMIKTTGHLIVVEGVETQARLDLMRATGIVDCVQGYEISRPLSIDEFVAFLGRDKIAPRAREVAA